MSEVIFVIVNSKAYYQDSEVKQVDVPSVQGSFGILPKHVPAIASLKPGIVTVFEESEVKKFFGKIVV
jgi:F-type H+-transporting ATPase subunit delta